MAFLRETAQKLSTLDTNRSSVFLSGNISIDVLKLETTIVRVGIDFSFANMRRLLLLCHYNYAGLKPGRSKRLLVRSLCRLK